MTTEPTNVLALFRYAMQQHQWQPDDVCSLFGAPVRSQLAAKIQKRFNGDYSAAAAEIDRYVIRMEQVVAGAQADEPEGPPPPEESAAQARLEV